MSVELVEANVGGRPFRLAESMVHEHTRPIGRERWLRAKNGNGAQQGTGQGTAQDEKRSAHGRGEYLMVDAKRRHPQRTVAAEVYR